jgi:hypothetical protein
MEFHERERLLLYEVDWLVPMSLVNYKVACLIILNKQVGGEAFGWSGKWMGWAG